MLTKNEITALSLSPTKKDFVQIWNELLEVAGKLSERWDPTSTNESDPGIVILKALTGIADKLNYTIDKNILEAFMPTASQEDSMRKLCDMLGYNVKYYRSAETDVTIKYHTSDPSEDEDKIMSDHGNLSIPKFTVITNSDKDISYFTTNPVPYYISKASPSVSVPCMEGQIVKCESTADNNVITAAQITENNRFYLPEAQIAENGIFVYNVFSAEFDDTILADGTPWEKVDNLNIQAHGSRVFKFGYDSYESRPYIEFPSDYSELINDGLFIYYARTSGINGNISPKTLSQLEKPSSENWAKVAAESFIVENTFAATSGANIETIKQAYNNFKKTIGTFETLVTCRDYMNKIYTMTGENGKSLVSNILVTDIRNDLNRAVTICSCADAGIFYKETPLTEQVVKTLKRKDSDEEIEVEDEKPAINHFDLVFYPFKAYNQIKNNVKNIQEAYDASFNYSAKSFDTVNKELASLSVKTIAHNIIPPRQDDVVSINNYLKLSAIIGTNAKMTVDEGTLLVETIKIALANAFNMRELDFGEEIPFESIIEVIEKADSRIKVVSLNEPALYTTFSVFEGIDTDSGTPILKEYAVASDNWLTEAEADATGRFDMQKDSNGNYYSETFNSKKAKEIYNKLVIRNVLAGRVPLFKYNETFKPSFSEGPYRVTSSITAGDVPFTDLQWDITDTSPAIKVLDGVTYTRQPGTDGNVIYTKTYTPSEYADNIITKSTDNITEIKTSCKIFTDKETISNQISDVTLATGEFVQFRAPNFITTKTYPAYVNYHLHLNQELLSTAKNAEAFTLFDLLDTEGKRGAALSFFSALGKLQTLKLTQTISRPEDTLVIENPPLEIIKNRYNTALRQSGFIKVKTDEHGKAQPIFSGAAPTLDSTTLEALDIASHLEGGLFITDSIAFKNITNYVDTVLQTALQTHVFSDDWTISYEFEYVPFDSSTIAEWENFIKLKTSAFWGFTPKQDVNIVLWRKFAGNTYIPGKYILTDGSKLMPLTVSHLALLDEYQNNRLEGVFLAKDLGEDAKTNIISNNTEYELLENEYLCVEYTPSTTTEESSTAKPVKEVYGPGTIIKPSGFEEGISNSSTNLRTALKSAKFTLPDKSESELALFSLGANEQIEIREKSRIVLNESSFNDSAVIYVYKNFHNCPELEEATYDASNQRINNTYTLKDGEYIFYTDQNQTELAYFASGTAVTLRGNLTLPKLEIIDLATIFDLGIQEIPWYRVSLTSTSSSAEAPGIEFQEYQYITLEAGDRLDSLVLFESDGYLDEEWRPCHHGIYTIAGSDKPVELPKISLASALNAGCGWEACSTLALNISPSTVQTLRTTDKVETGVALYKNNSADPIILKVENKNNPPLSFKANIACQSSNGKAKIDELYTNPNNKVKSFEFKVFSEAAPTVLKTIPGTLIPQSGVDKSGSALSEIVYNEFWYQVDLNELTPGVDTKQGSSINYDRTLRLATSILPETYGIFSIYLKYDYEEKNTWIELLPGVSKDALTLFNFNEIEAESAWSSNKLILKPGLNCIKVNTTCDLFIKTDAGTQGNLYFDTLRLVHAPFIEYTENGSIRTVQSKGLNLAQLGYLDASDSSSSAAFDASIRKQLKTDYIKSAIAKIESEEQALVNKFTSEFNKLLDIKPTIEKVAEFLEDTITEVNTLYYANTDDLFYRDEDELTQLLLHFKALSDDLDKELALKTALVDNTTIDKLEQQLTDLLGDSLKLNAAKQELIVKLEKLRADAITNADTFVALPKEDIIADALSCPDPTAAVLIAELKVASLTKIDAQYNEQLDLIKDKLNSITSKKTDLESALAALHTAKQKELLNQIQALINANNSSLSELIDEACTEAQSAPVNYSTVVSLLQELRRQAKRLTIEALVNELAAKAEMSMYPDITSVITELKALLLAEDTNLSAAIDTALASVQAKITANTTTTDSAVIQTLISIKTKITQRDSAAIADLLDGINDTITTALNNYATFKDKLNSVTDEQVKQVAIELVNIANIRSTKVAEVEAFTNIKNYVTLPFGEEVLLTLWPKRMKLDLIKEVDTLCGYIRAALTTGGVDLAISVRAAMEPFSTAISISEFKELFTQALYINQEISQNSKRELLINDISKQIDLIPKLESALDDIKSDTTLLDRNAALCYVINRLQDTTAIPKAAEKRQLLQRLAEELDKAIKLDTQLVAITAGVLCPHILLPDTYLPEDSFYANLKNFALGLKTKLLTIATGTTLNADLNTDLLIPLQAKLDLVNNYITKLDIKRKDDFKALLVNFATPAALETNLADALLSNIKQLFIDARSTIISQQQLASVKNCGIFNYLATTEVITLTSALETSTGGWTDSSDKAFKAYSENVWSDGEGKWQYNDDTKVTVDVKRDKDGHWYGCGSSLSNTIIDGAGSWLISNSGTYTAITLLDTSLATKVDSILSELLMSIVKISHSNIISNTLGEAYKTLKLEKQLLEAIQAIDKNRIFYYNVNIEPHVAIDFNENDAKLNTLMNPASNYDINNVNNSFVISKLDINYLTSGIQTARSSRI